MVPVMTRTLLAFAALVASAAPAAAAERRYAVADFERVVVEGPYIVRLTAGTASAATASGSPAALDRVTIDVSGRTLRIRRNRSSWGGDPGAQEGPLTVSSHHPRPGAQRGRDRLGQPRGRPGRGACASTSSVSGSGRLTVAQIEADNLIARPGSAPAELPWPAAPGGTQRRPSRAAATSPPPRSPPTTSQIHSDTAGTVVVAVAFRTAKVTASGPGDVEIIGTPSAGTVEAKGSGQILCGPAR